MLLQIAQQPSVVVELEIGVHAALQEHARATPRDQLLDLLADLLVCQQVGLWAGGLAIEGAKAAVYDADVRVVDVAVYQIGDDAIWMFVSANRIGGGDQRVGLGLLVESHALIEGESLTCDGAFQQVGGQQCSHQMLSISLHGPHGPDGYERRVSGLCGSLLWLQHIHEGTDRENRVAWPRQAVSRWWRQVMCA